MARSRDHFGPGGEVRRRNGIFGFQDPKLGRFALAQMMPEAGFGEAAPAAEAASRFEGAPIDEDARLGLGRMAAMPAVQNFPDSPLL